MGRQAGRAWRLADRRRSLRRYDAQRQHRRRRLLSGIDRPALGRKILRTGRLATRLRRRASRPAAATDRPARTVDRQRTGTTDRTGRTARRQLIAGGTRLQALLASHGIASHGSALFQWWPEPKAEEFWRHMAERGIWVRLFPQAARGIRLGLPPDEAGL